MSLFDRFRKPKATVAPYVDTRAVAHTRMMAAAGATINWINPFPVSQSGGLNFMSVKAYNPTLNRKLARGVYEKSLIGKNLVRRTVDNVINVGLTWESSPIWDLIPDAPKDKKEQYLSTKNSENHWKLYSNSKECDAQGIKNGGQIQRMLERLAIKEGEFFVIYRYLNSPKRVSPVALQIINNDQVVNPSDRKTLEAIKARGGSVKYGIEFDSTGKEVAIYAYNSNYEITRIPFFGAKSGRRFVSHYINAVDPGQFRGVPELSDLHYEVSQIAQYEEAELEATVESAKFMGAIESDIGAAAPTSEWKVADLKTPDGATDQNSEFLDQKGNAVVVNDLGAGRKLKMYQPTRPNQNYEKYLDAIETRVCGALGMTLSVFKQQFGGSYSSSRVEILLYWNAVLVRRDEMVAGFLNDWNEAVMSEWVNSGAIKMPGFDSPIIRKAWLNGFWTGISRPVVDPNREVKAIETRTKLGHTTGEKEAKAYNGSDFQENTERLVPENLSIAKANEPLDPSHYAKATETTGQTE